MSTVNPTPRVFISYSWTNPEHEQWVVELAEKLSGDGLHVILDKYDLQPGQDVNAFMEQMVTAPDLNWVLAVCDKRYMEKANNRAGGVGTESQIISQQVYSKVAQTKFVAIVREYSEGKPCIPVFFDGRLHIDLSSEERFHSEYERLLRHLHGRPAHRRPEIGTPPSYLFQDDQTRIKTAHHFQRLKDALTQSKPNASGLLADYLDLFDSTLEDFRIPPGSLVSDIDEAVLKSIEQYTPYRDEFIEFIFLAFRYKPDDETFLRVFSFFEKLLRYKIPLDINRGSPYQNDNYRFFILELFLYTGATLLKLNRFDAMRDFLARRIYGQSDRSRRNELFGIEVFQSFPASLEEVKNKKLPRQRISVTADLLKERATHRLISFDEIMQVDLVYRIAAMIRHSHWLPVTLVFANNGWKAFEVFDKARSLGYYKDLVTLFGSGIKENLLQVLADNPHADSIFGFHSHLLIRDVTNLDKWATMP